MSKPWGGVGAWALEAERAEAEELAAAAPAPAELFPSLKEAASAKPKKKKKPVAMSLSELNAIPSSAFKAGSNRGGGGGGGGLTHDEMLRLPSGPKERSAEEIESSRFGRGFQSYGSGSGPGSGPRRGYGGGLDEDSRRGPPQARDPDLPSRADEADSWASAKKPFPADSGPGRHDRYASLGSGSSSSSKADEADNWFSSKKMVQPAPSRSSGFGSGFRDSISGSGPSDSDRWVRGEGFPESNNGERRRLVLDPPKAVTDTANVEQARNRPSPFGAARPREDVLAGKGVDWRKADTDIDVKKSTSRPTSSQSSRPSSAQSSRPGSPGDAGAMKPRQKVNPFGDARPREVLLEEKGKDWRKIDLELEHRRVDRPETDEMKLLREEINHLKKELSKETEGNLTGESAEHTAEQATSLHEQISQKEKDLEKLTWDLDGKVQFRHKATSEMRPGSGAGRMSEEPRNMDFTERPRSRGGIGDSWANPMDDRRGSQGGRESSFFGGRNMDSGDTGWHILAKKEKQRLWREERRRDPVALFLLSTPKSRTANQGQQQHCLLQFSSNKLQLQQQY